MLNYRKGDWDIPESVKKEIKVGWITLLSLRFHTIRA